MTTSNRCFSTSSFIKNPLTCFSLLSLTPTVSLSVLSYQCRQNGTVGTAILFNADTRPSAVSWIQFNDSIAYGGVRNEAAGISIEACQEACTVYPGRPETAGPEYTGHENVWTGKCRTGNCRTKRRGWKMQDQKMRDRMSGLENAQPEFVPDQMSGLENAGQENEGLRLLCWQCC